MHRGEGAGASSTQHLAVGIVVERKNVIWQNRAMAEYYQPPIFVH